MHANLFEASPMLNDSYALTDQAVTKFRQISHGIGICGIAKLLAIDFYFESLAKQCLCL